MKLRLIGNGYVGSWKLEVGSWQLAVGSWQLADYGACDSDVTGDSKSVPAGKLCEVRSNSLRRAARRSNLLCT